MAEAGGRAILVGEGTPQAAGGLSSATWLAFCETGPFAPARWAATLGPLLAQQDLVLLPGSPDGRDLAPRLAHVLARPLWSGAIRAGDDRVVVGRRGGLVAEEHALSGPAVATLVPGCRGVEAPDPGGPPPQVSALAPTSSGTGSHDATIVEVLAPDPATMDLAEAPRIMAGGAGLGSPEAFEILARVAAALGAAAGATRVVTDAGWMPPTRQIGTTGVTVSPRCYLALGISGAVQHLTGLGQPEHVVAVNLDPSCPMMAMADLAIVADAPALLAQLAERLGVAGPACPAGVPEGSRG